MLRNLWLRTLTRRWFVRPSSSSSKRRTSLRRLRLGLEPLEDRVTPSTTITVNDASGGMDNAANVTVAGLGSKVTLIDAINAANNTSATSGGSYVIDLSHLPANSIITFTQPLNNMTITSNNVVQDQNWYGPDALPAISSNITIQGHGDTLAIFGTAMRFFYVSGGPTLTGGALSLGTLELDNLTLEDGRVQGGNGSGGITLQTNNYNAQGQVTSIVSGSNGNVLTYTYSNGIRTSATLNASTANGGALLQTYHYNTQGQLSTIVYANGNTLTYTYTNGVLSSATLTNSSGATLRTYNYSYNAQGQVSSIKDGNGNLLDSYTYDSLGRVATVTIASNGDILTYTYNSDGTSSATLTTSSGTPIATYKYDVFGRVTEIDYANGSTYKRTYPANGTSTATLTNSSGQTIETYTYNAQGNLVSHNP
jgi:YD repeat-containing protein